MHGFNAPCIITTGFTNTSTLLIEKTCGIVNRDRYIFLICIMLDYVMVEYHKLRYSTIKDISEKISADFSLNNIILLILSLHRYFIFRHSIALCGAHMIALAEHD